MVVEIEQVIRLAGQRNKQIRLEKINREIAGYQFEEVMRTLRQELGGSFYTKFTICQSHYRFMIKRSVRLNICWQALRNSM